MFHEFDHSQIFSLLGATWCGLGLGHLLSEEQSQGRRALLKVFAKHIELPLLRSIYAVCLGRLRFLTKSSIIRKILGVLITRPFGKYMDTGVPLPAKEAVRLLRILEGKIAVGDCRCRLAVKTCDHPMPTDIVIRSGAEAWLWAFPDNYHVIDKDEAIGIVEECARQDMFPMVFIHCSTASSVNEYVICNCCTCGCKVHLLNRTMGQENFPLRDGGFRSFHDPGKCKRCGRCVDRCPFGAIALEGNLIRITDCYGCGICEQVCENGAYTVKRVEPGPPWAQEAWGMLEREDRD